jgi:predicted Zn-dependent protease
LTALALCTAAAFAIAAPAEPLRQSAQLNSAHFRSVQFKPNNMGLPTLGDTARQDLSPVIERKLGEEIMRDVRRDPAYLDDDPIIEYLNNLGNALVAAAPGTRGEMTADFSFFAMRDANLNAFALPGGFIAAHTGLIVAAQNESELAGVMAHEIGHVSQRHIARALGQQKQDVLLPLAAMILAALASKASPDAAMGVLMGGQGLAVQRQLNFSRDAEREADRVGFQIMGAGGYDVTGMAGFFKRLQSASKLAGDIPANLAHLSSHPLTAERLVDMQARIREIPKKARIDPLDFQLVRARARVLQDESVGGRRDTRIALETQLKDNHRQLQAGAQYGLAVMALRQGNVVEAQSWLDKARATVKPKEGVLSAESHAGDGAVLFDGLSIDIKLAAGQPQATLEQALNEADAARQRYPLSRAIARQYAEALIATGKYDEATRYLRDQAQSYREDPKLHDMLARAYSKQGKIALQHMALAESYAVAGALPAAVAQLDLARKAGDVSFYDQAVIDARERELRARQKAEKEDEKDRP